jgi:hypothetical protein
MNNFTKAFFTTKSKSIKWVFALITLFLLNSQSSLGQQVIGSFPYMDGGFEGQSTGALGTTLSATAWTRQSQSGASTTVVTTTPRTGVNYVTVINVATASRGLQSPQTATLANGPQPNTSYTIQYFIKNPSIANYTESINTNGTTNNNYGSAVTVAANANWTKRTVTKTSASTALTTAGILVTARSASAVTFDIDDVVLYAGSLDNTAPNSPASITVNNPTTTSLDVSWGAASGGVDGGGYVVVRYSSNPNADNDPNQNGIYAVGNTTTNGTGGLTGTVRYIGTGTSFTDNVGLSSGTQYWYKVYTVDKAFNYSAEVSGNGITTSAGCAAPSTQASSLTFSNVGSGQLDLGWTDGNGAGRVIIMNTTNSFTAPTTGSNPSANLTYGGSGEQVVFNGTASGGTPITIGGLSASTTYHFRIYEYCSPDRTYQTATATGNPASQATAASATTITTTANTYGPFCNNSSNGISVAYSTTGTLTGTFYAQISDASGNFTNGVFTGATIIGSGASPISATIPSGLAAGTGYRVRVINDTPATYGTDNGTAFTISAPPAITSGTLADASTNVGVATTFGVTATNAASYEWYVDTGSGFTGPIVDGTSGGVTYSNATTNILSVNPSSTAANGYKYKVTVNGNSPCGSVDSTPSGGATLSVSVAPVVIYQNPFESGTLSSPTYTGGTTTLAANLSSSVWTIGSGTLQLFGGSSGNALGVSAGATSSPYTLTFTVAPGYQLSVSSYSFWKQTSNSALVNSVTINGITVSSGPATSATGNTGTLTVANAVSGLTGTITVVLNITGTGSFRLDDFTLSGNVSLTVGSNLAAYASQPSSDIASGSTNVPLAGFSVTPTPSADFTSVTVTGVSSSPSDITNVRIFRDNNGNGLIDGADASVSGAGIAFANGNLSAMTISGETGFSGARNYLIVADISASPSSTSVGVSIGSGNFVTSLASNTGSMAVNTRTLIRSNINLGSLWYIYRKYY